MTGAVELRLYTEAAATTAAVGAARELGILDLLEREPADAAAVAARLGLSSRGTSLLLECLVELGIVGRHDGTCRVAGGQTAALGAVGHLWDSLADAVRTGVGPVHADTASGSDALYPEVVSTIGDLMGPTTELVAKHLLSVRVTRAVLEVGAGAAPWSRALARLGEGIEVTALDLPSVLEVTRAHVEDDGLSPRYSYLPGDVFEAVLPPAAFDLVLVPNLCHLFGDSANRRLLAHLSGALSPGGRLAVIDVLPATKPERRRQVSLYALGLMVRTDTGGVHSLEDYADWLGAAGLTSVERWDAHTEPGITVITASRP